MSSNVRSIQNFDRKLLRSKLSLKSMKGDIEKHKQLVKDSAEKASEAEQAYESLMDVRDECTLQLLHEKMHLELAKGSRAEMSNQIRELKSLLFLLRRENDQLEHQYVDEEYHVRKETNTVVGTLEKVEELNDRIEKLESETEEAKLKVMRLKRDLKREKKDCEESHKYLQTLQSLVRNAVSRDEQQ